MGDSNTQDIQFGTGSGTVGESFPGKRVRAAKIKDIDPVECVSHSNIILHCGTNDLRDIRHPSEIHKLADILRNKLTGIRTLCPKAKIFVMPVPPTRIPEMNQNIMTYNEIVSSMLNQLFADIWFPSVKLFLDEHYLLSYKLTRNGDAIHLGSRGIARYVSYIKSLVYVRVKRESSPRHSPSSPGPVRAPTPPGSPKGTT